MKTYKLLKDLPWCTIWMLFQRNNKDQRYYEGKECNSWMFNDALAEWYLEEVKIRDYIVTEEGEIIGEYEWDCWYFDRKMNIHYTYGVSNSIGHFITKEQCDGRKKKESALRKLWELYYENWYEENKGGYEVYALMKRLDYATVVANPALPHCNELFQQASIKLPEIKALYLTYFWIDELDDNIRTIHPN
jgi:hypothetical protein